MRNRMALVGLGVVSFFAAIGLFAGQISPYSPLTMSLGQNYVAPSAEHFFGTDELGRDVFSRTLYGAQTDLALTFLTVVFAAFAGVAIGTAAAYWGGFADTLLMRCMDILLAFPVFLLGLVLVVFLGSNIQNVVFALAITRLPRYARLIRGLVLSIKAREYVEAARVVGTPDLSIITQHILPNSIAPIIIFASLDMGTTITALAGLSFLGVGIQPPTADWGLMLTSARNNLVLAPWTAIFPGLAISVSTIGFNFLGDGLRDAFDPRLHT